MLSKKLLILTLLSSLSLFANNYNLKPIKITKDITCVIGDFNPPKQENKGFVSNMCYVDIGNSLVVLDAGPTYIFAKEFYDLMQKEYPNKKVTNVVLSNFHDDRVQGASFFKDMGAKIIGHKLINDDIIKNPNKFKRMQRLFSKSDLKGTKLIHADTLVDNDYKITGSKKVLTVLKLSEVSEERSDIAIYSKDDNFLFTGNIVFNGRMLNYTKHSDINGWIEALEKITTLNANYILGGHGKEFDKDAHKASLNYLKTLKKNVTYAFENDIDREDIKIDANLFSNIPYYRQLNHNNINNYYDQLEWAE